MRGAVTNIEITNIEPAPEGSGRAYPKILQGGIDALLKGETGETAEVYLYFE